MTKVRYVVLLSLAGFAVSLGSIAHGGTIYDSLTGATTISSDPVTSFGPLADSFSTIGATTLVDVKFLLTGDPTAGGTTIVYLLSDASTSPGSVIAQLGSINDSSLTSSFTVQDVSGFAPVALNAGTRYWIELSSTNSSAFWAYTYDIMGPGVAGEFFANSAAVFPNYDGPYQMQVNTGAVPIPEPTAFALAMIGIGTLVALRRPAFRRLNRGATR